MSEPTKIPTVTSAVVQGPLKSVSTGTPGSPLTPEQQKVVNQQLAQNPGAIIPDSAIEARPLTLPNTLDVKLKNPNLAVKWVNRVAGGGRRIQDHLAMGFVMATPSDVDLPASMLKDGKYVDGDVVLMKIDRIKYVAALKYNELKAVQRVERKDQTQRARNNVREALAEVGAPAELAKKVQAFVPSQDETDSLTK